MFLKLAPAPPVLVPHPESESTRAPQAPADLPSTSRPPASDSEERVGPTCASIRAWAKATPAGAPRYTPSPYASALHSSGSDENESCVSLTRSANRTSDSPHPHRHRSRVASSGSYSSDQSPDSIDREMETEESPGNVADGESSGSEPASTWSPNASPLSSPPLEGQERIENRESLAPHPHPGAHNTHSRSQPHQLHHNYAHAHAHAHLQAPYPNPQGSTRACPYISAQHPHPAPHSDSSSASPPPELTPENITTHWSGHQGSRDRRMHHHQPNSRRRHRDRDRDRDWDRHREQPPSLLPPPPPSLFHTELPLHTLPPLRPLPPPPPPLIRTGIPRARAENADVLCEITKMLTLSSNPLLPREGAAESGLGGGGWVPLRVSREDDVLDDIYKMVMLSSRM
ncbi:hypothetical protein C8Q73DRAFT_474618 [Cubamyces lactineus]|nr:hypothetical protein C8Q73DRAFT_474618 [Cubamyces lactineus]